MFPTAGNNSDDNHHHHGHLNKLPPPPSLSPVTIRHLLALFLSRLRSKPHPPPPFTPSAPPHSSRPLPFSLSRGPLPLLPFVSFRDFPGKCLYISAASHSAAGSVASNWGVSGPPPASVGVKPALQPGPPGAPLRQERGKQQRKRQPTSGPLAPPSDRREGNSKGKDNPALSSSARPDFL